MLPDRVSNPGPLTYESGDLPIALLGPISLFGGVGGLMGAWETQYSLLLDDLFVYCFAQCKV